MGSNANPLKVIVIGGGIAGLTVALGLRRQGHHVHVYEKSALLKEYGAAIAIGPNANAVLRKLGLFLENDAGGVPYHGYCRFVGDELTLVKDQRPLYAPFKAPFQFALRQDLHRGLAEIARKADGPGHPVTITTSARVIDVDINAPSITLESGEIIKGDLVIGADGVHSRTRNHVPGAADLRERPFGKSAYRTLFETDDLLNDPTTRPLVANEYHQLLWTDQYPYERSVLMYPAAGGTKMNFVAIRDSIQTDPSLVGQELKEKLLSDYGPHSKLITAVIDKIDPTSFGIWTNSDMEAMPSFIASKLALIGDAAHPFLPFWGQGAAMAMEDAAFLAAQLPLGTKPDDLTKRLQLYNQARYGRAEEIRTKSRNNVKQNVDFTIGNPVFAHEEEGYKNIKWVYSYDAWEESEKLLRESTAS